MRQKYGKGTCRELRKDEGMSEFKDKVVVVTGGANGIGKSITDAVLYLCSDKAGFINGENICIDGGMTHQMIYHADNGWTLS